VGFDPMPGEGEGPASVDQLALAAAPRTSRLHWLRPGQPKVPVDVAATGPKVIALAAVLAERVTFAVGADPERLAWAVATARRARADAGLDQQGLSLGAYVNVVAHPDVAVGRTLAAGGLASFARFSVMHGTPTGPVTDDQRTVLREISQTYDMAGHFRAGSPQSAALTGEFFERFGIIGRPADCVDRLRHLADLGLDRLVIVGPAAGADREEAARAGALLLEEVLPALR
jgi:5,10-methylenetetrahydromethanopterin reductase